MVNQVLKAKKMAVKKIKKEEKAVNWNERDKRKVKAMNYYLIAKQV